MSQAPEDDDERTIVRPSSSKGGPREASVQLGHTLPNGTRIRDYEITSLIGEGGFGIVYLAYDHSLQRSVAIKEYMPSSMASRVNASATVIVKSDRHQETFKAGLRSFVNEARLLARFDHPALVKVYRFWEENGTAYMVMPFYEGPTLKSALALLGRPPDEAELRAWLHPLLDALGVMHAAQCYHRDIAPDNILLTPSGPLLLDFGAARRVIGDMTHALTVVLKPGYAPIEQYGDVATMAQGAWTDLYALACVISFAITGKVPMSSVERLMDDRLEPLARTAAGRYSPGLLRAVDAALAVRPQDRPQTDAQFRALLDSPAAGRQPATVPVTAPRVAAPLAAPPSTPAARDAARTAPAAAPPMPVPLERAVIVPRTTPPAPVAPPPAAMAAPTRVRATPSAAHGAGSAAARPMASRGAPASGRRTSLRLGIAAACVVALGAAGYLYLGQRASESPPPKDNEPAASAPFESGPPGVSTTAPLVVEPAAAPVTAPSDTPTLTRPAAVVVERPTPEPAPAPARAPAPAPAPTPVPAPTTTPVAAPVRAPTNAPLTGATREPAATTAPDRSPAAVPATDAAPARVRREPAVRAEATPVAPRAAPSNNAAVQSRCSDILQKASLEPLTGEEAAFLKRECR